MLGGFPGQAEIGMLLGLDTWMALQWRVDLSFASELRGVRRFTTIGKYGIVVCRDRSAGQRQGISVLRIRRTIYETMYFF